MDKDDTKMQMACISAKASRCRKIFICSESWVLETALPEILVGQIVAI